MYVDVRNLLNRRNIESVRRESGEPNMTPQAIAALGEQRVPGASGADSLRIAALSPMRT
jgi:hypothetical protein